MRSAADKVRFVGDPVAAVIARDEATAAEAVDLVQVEYEPLRTFGSPTDSLAYPEPRIHDYGDAGNVHKAVSLQFGDVDAAISGADHVFDDVFFFEGSTHLPIEQHATVAAKDPDGKLVVWSSTQTPHYLHRALAKALQQPAAHIRVIATPNGGGFGGKSDPFNHEVVVARAALMLDRPVKICLTREEVFYCHRGRHPVLMRFRTGVTKDGRITGVDLQTLLDGGAYGSVRRGQHVLHGRAADGHLRHPGVPVPRLPRVHQQAARAGPSAGMARRRGASARRCSSTRLPSGCRWTRPTCA